MRVVIVRPSAILHGLLKVDEVGEPTVRQGDALGFLLRLYLEVFGVWNELLRGGLLVDDIEVGGAVEDGVEEFGEGVEFVYA